MRVFADEQRELSVVYLTIKCALVMPSTVRASFGRAVLAASQRPNHATCGSHVGRQAAVSPLIVAGGGGAALIVGLIVYGNRAKDVKDFEKKCPNRLRNGTSTRATRS